MYGGTVGKGLYVDARCRVVMRKRHVYIHKMYTHIYRDITVGKGLYVDARCPGGGSRDSMCEYTETETGSWMHVWTDTLGDTQTQTHRFLSLSVCLSLSLCLSPSLSLSKKQEQEESHHKWLNLTPTRNNTPAHMQTHTHTHTHTYALAFLARRRRRRSRMSRIRLRSLLPSLQPRNTRPGNRSWSITYSYIYDT